jgi:hypothetical protein
MLLSELYPEPLFDVGSSAKANPALREALRARLISHFEAA